MDYERAWKDLYKKYAGTVIADLRRGGCDYDEFQWPLDRAETYMSEQINDKFAQIESFLASSGMPKKSRGIKSREDMLLKLIYCGYTNMILAFCMHISERSRVVIYTDYSDFSDLKTDVENDFDNIRMFSSSENFVYTRFPD